MESTCQMAIEILRSTNDGDDLAPWHLSLLQLGVNDNLNKIGHKEFNKLHSQVISGTYNKPFHFDVEHVTKDHAGYVYWKGIKVEHYSFRSSNEEKLATAKFAEVCNSLETGGLQVNCTNYLNACEELRANSNY